MGETIVIGLANGGIYGLLALGLVLVYKGSRVLNFAQGEIGGFGLYIAWALIEKAGLPWVAGAAIAIVMCAVIGGIFERVVVRPMIDAPRLGITVATIAVLLFFAGLELKLWGTSPQILRPPIEGLGPEVFGFFVSPARMLALAAVIVIGTALALFLRRTDFGLGVLAASQDPSAVRLMGVPLARVSSFTWVAAGALSALAALLIEPTIGVISPGLMTRLFIPGLAAALLGGLTSLPGAFAGGLAIGVIESTVGYTFVDSTFPGIDTVAVMLVIIAVLVVRPQGILGRAVAA
ncbi:MAG: branched-chain amino acid ABC transporter permease [Actinomycetota bacterium]